MEIVFPRIARYLYDVYLESKDSGNCAMMLEKEFHTMFGFNDEHDCNVVSVNSLNIHVANDDCTSHDNDVSYKNVDFCGVNWE
jgi:hypothetical protein